MIRRAGLFAALIVESIVGDAQAQNTPQNPQGGQGTRQSVAPHSGLPRYSLPAPNAVGSRVTIQASEMLEYSVVPRGALTPIAVCKQSCEFWALPGRYTLYASELGQVARSEFSFRIKRSMHLVLDKGNPKASSVGLTVGAAGGVAMCVGLALTLPVVISAMSEHPQGATVGEQRAAAIGLGLLGAGAIATPIGFGVFLHNRSRLRQFDEVPQRVVSEPSRSHVGLVGLARPGLGVGVALAF